MRINDKQKNAGTQQVKDGKHRRYAVFYVDIEGTCQLHEQICAIDAIIGVMESSQRYEQGDNSNLEINKCF